MIPERLSLPLWRNPGIGIQWFRPSENQKTESKSESENLDGIGVGRIQTVAFSSDFDIRLRRLWLVKIEIPEAESSHIEASGDSAFDHLNSFWYGIKFMLKYLGKIKFKILNPIRLAIVVGEARTIYLYTTNGMDRTRQIIPYVSLHLSLSIIIINVVIEIYLLYSMTTRFTGTTRYTWFPGSTGLSGSTRPPGSARLRWCKRTSRA